MATYLAARPELRRNLLLVGCCVAGLALNCLIALANSSAWDVDFNQYYSAGKLVGSGHLYDWSSIRALQLEHNAKAVPFGRIRPSPLPSSRFRPCPIRWRAHSGCAPVSRRWRVSSICGPSQAGRGRASQSAGRRRRPMPRAGSGFDVVSILPRTGTQITHGRSRFLGRPCFFSLHRRNRT